MNKQQAIVILQTTLFKYDHVTGSQVLKLNPSYDIELVKLGIKLYGYLQSIKIK